MKHNFWMHLNLVKIALLGFGLMAAPAGAKTTDLSALELIQAHPSVETLLLAREEMKEREAEIIESPAEAATEESSKEAAVETNEESSQEDFTSEEEALESEFGSDEGAQEAGEESVAVFTSGYTGPVLNSFVGTVQGPSGKETYYNLDMSGVVSIMRGMGNTDEYWVREDGCKMLGDYIMCAANLEVHPRGTLVESSLGMCIVCDTGGFAYDNPYQLDIATTW